MSTQPPFQGDGSRERGERAEDVASWYFRLNGFLSIPGFVLHLDHARVNYRSDGTPRIARTEADLIAVRFPFSREIVGGRPMQDAVELLPPQSPAVKPRPIFVLAEVKAGHCAMNGPWTNQHERNMQRVLRRLGFTDSENIIESAASELYDSAKWEGNAVIVQYICVGGQKSEELSARHAQLIQIDWQQIGRFLFHRFSGHPEKTPSGFVHDQWPRFGRKFGEWFRREGSRGTPAASGLAVERYVGSGRLREAG